ncbi:esterase-like activity of phytase family protein [Sphingomonas immobilis]|uniref:Esterase-like activity of phytase family protein n=1 Tax=Sphingomonas immobilis TaxID=3063997 RepID=A0ABT9A4I5_9SPHN|nr:esterase-like activity of phytase family protein [Sphingomonas sp. CA1-15]MDO7843876.1 esterase-like activity of phytase family protein [Sphingomonas sp. CA1-15]
MRILLSCLLLLLLLPSWSGSPRLPLMGATPVVWTQHVQLDANRPGLRRVGALTFIGGVRLTSPDHAFGGFSALHGDGRRLTLLSDGGNIVRFALDAGGRAHDVWFGDLPAGPGRGWDKEDRDSESMSADPKDGSMIAGFEGANAFWRYSADMTRLIDHAAPRAMQDWNINGGPEAFTMLPGGGAITIAEFEPDKHAVPGRRPAIRFTGDPIRAPGRGYRFGYAPPPLYDPTDIAVLPDGRLIVLNRRFVPPFAFWSKLVVIDPAAIRPGALVRGTEIATLAPPLIHENFEGMYAARANGATILWLVSDDNQSALQRSLLLKFRLDLPPRAKARQRGGAGGP